MIDKIIKALTFLIALILLGYIVILKMPKASVKSKDVVAEISAEDLYEAFTTDEQLAQDKFLGKAVIVTGLIDDKYEDETGAPVLILRSEAGESVALVTLESSERTKVGNFNIHDHIKVKAQCSGMLMEVTLSKGIILN